MFPYWRCEVRNKKKDLGGLKYILAGLALMALSTAIIEVVFLFKHISLLNWADIAVHFVGWIMVVVGLYCIRGIRNEFSKGFIVAILGTIMLVISGGLAFLQYKDGLGETAFIDIYVMFASYLADIAMLSVYFLLVRGMGQLVAKSGNGALGKNSLKLSRLGIGVVLGSMVLTPFSYVFPVVIKFILALIFIAAGLVMQFAMIIYVNQGYKEVE